MGAAGRCRSLATQSGQGTGISSPGVQAERHSRSPQMLKFAGAADSPGLCLLPPHDDKVRDSEYTAGAEKALELCIIRSDLRGAFVRGLELGGGSAFSSEDIV